jgi:hypothetical protein
MLYEKTFFDDKYFYDIDFKYLNELDNIYDKYAYLKYKIEYDGRLNNRPLAHTEYTLNNILDKSVLVDKKDIDWKSKLEYIIYKIANKIGLLEKYITKHFDSEDSRSSKSGYYEDKIFEIEKDLVRIIDKEISL